MMNLRKFIFTGIALSAVLVSCNKEDEYVSVTSQLDDQLIELIDQNSNGEGVSFFRLPSETDLSKIPQDPLNPLTSQKVALGQLLVHETALGGDPKMEINKGAYTCASCHPAAAGFYAGLRMGIGEGGTGFGVRGEGRIMMPTSDMPRDSVDALPIKVPTIINVAYQEVALWNGALGGAGINAPFVDQNSEELPDNLLGFQGLEVQGMTGQIAHRLKIDEEFVDEFGYRELFDAAFPDVPQNERYSRIMGGLAIAAFNRTVLSNGAPWQKWLSGYSDALTDDQKEGAKLFFDKARCVECHTGPALKSMEFHAFGMGDLETENASAVSFGMNPTMGRGGFTGVESDEFKFKVPTIYNLKDNLSYGHGGTFTSIQAVIEYKNEGVKEHALVPDDRLAEQFGNTNLSEEEIALLVDFIENGLYDANIRRYAPESVLSGNCIPNNDPQSRIDLGCD